MSVQVFLYLDGSCLGNLGPGGYALILPSGPREKVIIRALAVPITGWYLMLVSFLDGQDTTLLLSFKTYCFSRYELAW
jgi:hypothetical protein